MPERNAHDEGQPLEHVSYATIHKRRRQIEAAWSDEERAYARIWDAVKPEDLPLWWCLDESLKERFRGEAREILGRMNVKLALWVEALT